MTNKLYLCKDETAKIIHAVLRLMEGQIQIRFLLHPYNNPNCLEIEFGLFHWYWHLKNKIIWVLRLWILGVKNFTHVGHSNLIFSEKGGSNFNFPDTILLRGWCYLTDTDKGSWWKTLYWAYIFSSICIYRKSCLVVEIHHYVTWIESD